MSFPRHPEIYPPMEAQTNTVGAPTHRLDEFPAGYSLAGCSPAWPASASPAGHQYALQSFCRSRIFQRTANSVLTVCVSRGGKRILLPTSRGTDTIVSTLAIVQDGDGAEKSIWAPQPRFVVSVCPPWWVIPLVASLFTLSFLLASVTSIKELPFIDTFPSLVTLLQGFASLQKPLAAISFMAASWIYLRKFPLK